MGKAYYAFFIESNKILIPFSDLDEHYKKKKVLELGQKNCIIQPHPLHYMLLKRGSIFWEEKDFYSSGY